MTSGQSGCDQGVGVTSDQGVGVISVSVTSDRVWVWPVCWCDQGGCDQGVGGMQHHDSVLCCRRQLPPTPTQNDKLSAPNSVINTMADKDNQGKMGDSWTLLGSTVCHGWLPHCVQTDLDDNNK